MPKFTLPPLKKPKKHDKMDNMAMPVESTGIDEYARRIDIPVNKAILDAVDTDDIATVTLTGKIVTKEDVTGTNKRQRITLILESVEVYPDQNSGKALKQAKKGFDRVREDY